MKKINGTVLIVDDDPFILDTAKMYLKQEIGEVITESNPERVPDLLDAHEIDVVLFIANQPISFRVCDTRKAKFIEEIVEHVWVF